MTTLDFHLLESLLYDPDRGLVLLEEHLDRLERSAKALCGADIDRTAIQEALRQATAPIEETCFVRVLVNRDGSLHAVSIPKPVNLAEFTIPVVLGLDAGRYNADDPFLRHKTTHRPIYEAALKGRPAGVDDMVLVNTKNEVMEACIYNVAAKINGVWITPDVEASGGLAGTYRAHLLKQGFAPDGIHIETRILPLSEWLAANAYAVFNSVRGWRLACLHSGC